MADELAGSVRVRVELDESGVPAQARQLGQKIDQEVERGGRKVGDDLIKRLSANLERGRAATAEAAALGKRISDAVENGGEDIGEDLVKQLERNIERGRRAQTEARKLGARITKAVDQGAINIGDDIVDELADQINQGGKAITAARALGRNVAKAVESGENPGEKIVNKLALQLEKSGRATLAARRLGERIQDAVDAGARGSGPSAGSTIADGIVADLADGLTKADAPINRFKLSLDRLNLSSFGDRITRAAGRLVILTRALAITSAAVAVLAGGVAGLQLAAAIVPALGAAALLPTAFLAIKTSVLTLKLAVSGLGEAFGAALGDDAAKFNEALQNLAPAAQRIAREVRAARPELLAFRQTVQGAFFTPLIGQVTQLVRVLAGPLSTAMAGVAAQFGRLAAGFGNFATSASGVQFVVQFFAAIRDTLAGIQTDTITNLFAAIGRFITATLPAFSGLGNVIDQALQRFSNFLNVAAGGGQAMAWIDGALDVLKQLVAVAGGAIGIVRGLLSAASASGGNALGVFGALIETINQFVNSVEGQRVLISVFSSIQQAVNLLGRTFAALGPGVGAVFAQLGNAVDVLSSSGGLEALATAAGSILAALAPLLPVAAQIAATLLNALAPAVASLAGPVAQVVETLGPAILQLGNSLGTAIGALAGSLGTALGEVLTALAPVVAELVTRLAPFLPQLAAALGQVVAALGTALVEALKAVGPSLGDLVGAVLELAAAFLPILPSILPLIPIVVRLAAQLLALQLQVLVPLIRGLAQLVRWMAPTQIGFNQLLVAVVGFVAELAGRVINALTRFFARIRSIGDIFSSLKLLGLELGRTIGGPIVAAFQRAQQFVVRLGQSLSGPARAGLNIVLGAARRVASFFSGRVNAVFGSVRSNAIRMSTSFTGNVRGALNVARETASRMLAYFRTLPARIRGVFSSSGTWLRSAGRNLITGLRSGVTSAMKGISSWVNNNIVKPIIAAVKKFFGIKSPSRVFAGIGGYLVQGLIKGLATANGPAIIKKIFGGMPAALGALINKGLVDVTSLPLRVLMKIGDALGGLFGGFGGGGFGAGLAFARAQVGKPYIWGGVGPGGFDCSGYLSAIENVIEGSNPYRRRFTSASFAGARRVGNWIRNLPSPFMLGARPSSHVAGTLLGVNVESSGSRGPHTGPSARGFNDRMFPYRYGLIPRVAQALSSKPRRRRDKEGEQFDLGGIARGIGNMSKNTLLPERVLSPIQTRAFERLVDVLSTFNRGSMTPPIVSMLAATSAPAKAQLPAKAVKGLETLARGGAPATAGAGGAGGGRQVVHNHTWNIHEVGDANTTAHRVINRLAAAYGGDV